MKWNPWVAALLVAIGVATVAGCQATRAGYESAPYSVVRSDGRFQVRDYPRLVLVETPSALSGSGDDGGFMRLFHYISGQNASKQKIAMTTPVMMTGDESHRTMAFVMPAAMDPGAAPQPSEGALAVREQSPGRFAVLRFKGGRGPDKESQALAKLKVWMTAQGLDAASGPAFAYFDPPWTPAFLRRNEVMVRIKNGNGPASAK